MDPARDNSRPPPTFSQPSGKHSQPVFKSKVKKKTKTSRQQVAVACLPCQKRKCRCDGGRPICSSCVSRNKKCEYNIDEGLSRVAYLKQENKSLADSAKDLQAIVDLLRKGTDSEAAAILARLRVGDPISTITQDAPGSSDDTTQRASRATSSSHIESPDPPLNVPEQLKTKPFFFRRQWGEPSTQRGLAAVAYQIEAASSQQPSQTSPTWEYGVPSPPADTVGQYFHPPPMMIDYHENNPQKFIKLRNFGNLDFSSGILSNNYPHEIQSQQLSNLFTPQWGMMTVATAVPSEHPMALMSKALEDIYTKGKRMLNSGAKILEIAGERPRIAALLDDAEFERAPILSQFAAKMVFAIKQTNREFVCYSSMYLFWWILRWMWDPTPETYSAIPEWLRPTPNQLFMPHTQAIDYFVWPGLRDYITQVPEQFEKPDWVMDMSSNIGVEWPDTIEEALVSSDIDGELDLSPKALAYASRLESWSVKPSFRKYLIDADRYLKIKFEDN